MDKDTRSRKWFITINNPEPKGYNHEVIKERLWEIDGKVVYWCMADEIGESGTYHTHIYLFSENAIRFSTVQKYFKGGEFEMAKGTSKQCQDYIFKQGKHANKSGKNLEETREESGECPLEKQGDRTDLKELYALIKEGLSDEELLELDPNYMSKLQQIDKVRQILRSKKYKNEKRNIFVEYIYGEPGSGKTSGTYERFGFENVYRVTNPAHPFDEYNGEEVLVFEEFRSSQFKIQEMLNYLDIYPLNLPARYGNKVACYSMVIFHSNIPLKRQYLNIQLEYPDTWKAFLRRIHLVRIYRDGQKLEYMMQDYLNSLPVGQEVSMTAAIKKWLDG